MKRSLLIMAAVLGLLLMAGCGGEGFEAASMEAAGAEEIVLSVEGMVCMACVGRVNRTLGRMEGVQRVDADLSQRTVRAWVDGDRVSADTLAKALQEMGYRTGEPGQER